MTLESRFSKEDNRKKTLPIQRVLSKLSDKLIQAPLGQPHFTDERYVSRDFSTKFFHLIPFVECDSKLGFIDGGNAAIYDSSNVTVHLSRVYFSLYKNGKRVNPRYLPQRLEFYTVCYAVAEKNRIFYEADLIPVVQDWSKYLPDLSGMKFNSFDPTLMTGRFRVPIGRIAESARRFAEWKYSGLICDWELGEGDAIIRDGTLQTSVTSEAMYSNKALKKAVANDVVFMGLAKTSGLFTSSGYPLFAAIAELAEDSAYDNNAWYYYPIVDISHPDHRAEMFAVKLHPNSDYVFRLEILKDQVKLMEKEKIEKYICALAACSKDASFPGYPYGLIDADRFARVSGLESTGQNLQFLSFADNSGVLKRLKKCLKTSDAHEILNKMVGE